jgi:hypothetical protein
MTRIFEPVAAAIPDEVIGFSATYVGGVLTTENITRRKMMTIEEFQQKWVGYSDNQRVMANQMQTDIKQLISEYSKNKKTLAQENRDIKRKLKFLFGNQIIFEVMGDKVIVVLEEPMHKASHLRIATSLAEDAISAYNRKLTNILSTEGVFSFRIEVL